MSDTERETALHDSDPEVETASISEAPTATAPPNGHSRASGNLPREQAAGTLQSEPAPGQNGQDEKPAASPGQPPGGYGSERAQAARRANALKSTGPRTEEGKQRVSQNARRSVRLLGLAEAQTLNQDLGAGERLYRELIAPFEPAPALVHRHFQDLARYCLEAEACERIRDALLEHRREQAALKRRRLFWEMEREVAGTLKEVFEKGLAHLPDSAGKFKEQVNCLRVLKENLEARNFDLKAVLHNLYGSALDPQYPRAQTICIRCEKLMKPEGDKNLTEEEFEGLLNLVTLEYQDALTAYGVALDAKTMSRAACLASLGPITREDVWLDRRGDQLRRAIDRKQRTITVLLRTLGLADRCKPNDASDGLLGEKKDVKKSQNKAKKPFVINRSGRKTKLKQS